MGDAPRSRMLWKRSRNNLKRGPARVVLSADREQFFVGENVLVHYCLENTGTSPISIDVGGDYRGSYRSIRFQVTVTGEDGARVSDPTPTEANLGGMASTPEIAPGESWCQSLSLLRYARIERAGTVIVTVTHDLGWNDDIAAPTGSMSLRFVMPDERQAGEVIDEALALPEDRPSRFGRKRAPYAQLAVLRAPVYLAALESRIATRKDRAGDLVAAIGGIVSPDAVGALIRLADSADASVAAPAAKALGARLPDPRLMERAEVSGLDVERRYLIETTYRPEHAAPARAVGRKLVASPDLHLATDGAFILRCVGERADLAAVAGALNRALEATLTPPSRGAGFYDTPRGFTSMLLSAAESFARRGVVPGAEPVTAGEIGVWLTAFKERDDFRPKGWEGVLGRATAHAIPRVRELALEAIPRPAPPAVAVQLPFLLADADLDVQVAACQAIARLDEGALAPHVLALLMIAHERSVLSACLHTAWMLGRRFEALQIAAVRLSDMRVAPEMLPFLSTIFADTSGYGAQPMSAEEAATARALWLPFLAANEALLRRDGSRLAAGDPRITPDMLPGMTLHFSDGSRWP